MRLQLKDDIKRSLQIYPKLNQEEKEILKKAVAAMEIQETQYFDEKKIDYHIHWHDIFLGMLTEEEKTNGFGWFLAHYGANMWNDLRFLFEDVFYLPKLPKGLSTTRTEDRNSEEYKQYIEDYKKDKNDIIAAYVKEWDNIKDKVLEPFSFAKS